MVSAKVKAIPLGYRDQAITSCEPNFVKMLGWRVIRVLRFIWNVKFNGDIHLYFTHDKLMAKSG